MKLIKQEIIKSVKQELKFKRFILQGGNEGNKARIELKKSILFKIKKDWKGEFTKRDAFLFLSAVKKGDAKTVEKMLKNGMNPNVYDKNIKTAVDYVYSGVSKVPKEVQYLLSLYQAKLSCELIDLNIFIPCPALKESRVEYGFVEAINEQSMKKIKHWIKVNAHQINLPKLYPYLALIIDLNQKNGRKKIQKLDVLKLFSVDLNMVNTMDRKETVFDFLLKEYNKKPIENKPLLQYLKSTGAKRGCELLKTKCEPLEKSILEEK